jgi:hypothetical protein
MNVNLTQRKYEEEKYKNNNKYTLIPEWNSEEKRATIHVQEKRNS